jgi:hypothetical protein
MKIKPENKIQQECLIYLAQKYPDNIIHSVPNEIPYALPAPIMGRIISLLQSFGMLKGAPDLIMHTPNGGCICIEIKKTTGKQSPEQIQFQKRIEKINGNYIVVHSLNELKQIL